MNRKNSFCTHCGRKANNDNFCGTCGNSHFRKSVKVSNKTFTERYSKQILATAIIFPLFLLSIIFAIISDNPRPNTKSIPNSNTTTSESDLPSLADSFSDISEVDYSEDENKLVGKVVAISDGDTITVLDKNNKQHKIRLAGIDTPEKSQDFGNKAKKFLSDLVYGNEVEVLSDKKDKYGRTVGKILIDGKDVNLELIKVGLAWHYKKYSKEQSVEDRKLYSDAEVLAKNSKLGLWSRPNPIAPWNFRYGKTNNPSINNKIIGNRNSFIYHWQGCPSFNRIAVKNRVIFDNPQAAENSGYRAARNCRTPKPNYNNDGKDDSSDEDESFEIQEIPKDESFVVVDSPKTVKAPRQVAERVTVPKPVQTPVYNLPKRKEKSSHPSGASALCRDGTYSYSRNRRGTCSHHGGVARWFSLSRSSRSRGSSYSSPSYRSTPSRSSGRKTVNVRGYYRKDGTYVRPHKRRAPKRKKY